MNLPVLCLSQSYLLFRCCVLPRHLNCPLTMIANLVHNASHSSILCEVNTIERPPFMTAVRASHRWRLALGSIPDVGSSWVKKKRGEDYVRMNWTNWPGLGNKMWHMGVCVFQFTFHQISKLSGSQGWCDVTYFNLSRIEKSISSTGPGNSDTSQILSQLSYWSLMATKH